MSDTQEIQSAEDFIDTILDTASDYYADHFIFLVSSRDAAIRADEVRKYETLLEVERAERKRLESIVEKLNISLLNMLCKVSAQEAADE
jgi:hypothetical protein